MNSLINNLTRFITTALQLYAPLPFQFTADLHKLKAYLYSYTEQEIQLDTFVESVCDKLNKKKKSTQNHKQMRNNSHLIDTHHLNPMLTHHNSCNIKYPELKLHLQTNNSHIQSSFNNISQYEHDSHRLFSQRSQDISGIKEERHKFKNNNKSKNKSIHDLFSLDKENQSMTINIVSQKNHKNRPESFNKTLKNIKSQIQLHSSNNVRKKSIDTVINDRKKNLVMTQKLKNESIDLKNFNNSMLKIKLKSKTQLDLIKIRENVVELEESFIQRQETIFKILNQLYGDDNQEQQYGN